MSSRTAIVSIRIATAVLFLCSSLFASADEIARIGEGTAIVFSPDFADSGNARFYESLGFLYIESADWREVVRQIREHNDAEPDAPIHVLIVESHGTNGNGLKLQRGKKPTDQRSYISIGGLQQQLDRSGVDTVVLSACNAGRLLRPEIYYTLDQRVEDPLFLPATLGVIDADPGYDRSWSRVKVLRRDESNLESLLHGSTEELTPEVRRRLGVDGRFAVSTMLIQILTRDPALDLVEEGFVREKSRADLSAQESERLFQTFVQFLHSKLRDE